MAGARSLNPTCEDYNTSDDSDHDSVVDFHRSPAQGPSGANVAAKRSHPSDLGTDKSPTAEKVVNIDLQSDSGYSSHTVGTMSSADSAPSAKARSPPVAPVNPASIPPASPATKKRSPIEKERASRGQESPQKPLQRRTSVSKSRPRPERRSTVTECTDPNCNQCESKMRGRRPKPSPLDSGLDVSFPPFDQRPLDQRSQRSDPAPASSYISPQSPTYTRQPDPYMRGPAVIQPGQTPRRRSSSTTRSARPQSYHGGDPSQGYWVPGMPVGYPSPPQEPHGPPPAMSAYHAMHHPQMPQYGMMGATPPNNYFHPPPSQTSPPYHDQRPSMHARNPSNLSTRRPTSQYGPPLLTQDPNPNRNMPSARYPSKNPASSREERFPASRFDDESSDSEYSEEDIDRALMPPPRRPSLRRPNTTQVYNTDRQSLILDSRDRDPRASRVSAAPSRSTSISRPAFPPKAQSSYDTRDAKVLVERAGSRRRQSYQSDYVQSNRRSKVYQDDSVVLSGNRRRQTDVDPQRRDENVGRTKYKDAANDVEAYQQQTRGSATPFNDSVHRAAKRASRVPSDAGSSRSKGSDKQSRVSQSARTNVTNGGGGEIRLRVDASAPLSLQFNGNMEGRTLEITPAEDGMAELVIGNSRGEDNTYRRSEKGSTYGGGSKKTVVSERHRREAEESSQRSSRSSQGRRVPGREPEPERRPLRRKDQIRYH